MDAPWQWTGANWLNDAHIGYEKSFWSPQPNEFGNGYWLAEFAAIFAILRKAPGQYGDAYEYSEDDEGDLTYFVLHQLRVVRDQHDAVAHRDAEQRDEAHHRADRHHAAAGRHRQHAAEQ